MTLALNTGHALYADLGMFICVNEAGTALVDLCTPSRTFTKHASAVFGTGALGRHFGARRNSPSGYSSYGFTFDTPYTPANNTGTLIVITNAVTSVEAATSGAGAFIGSGDASNGSRRLPQIGAQSGKIVGACFNNSGGDMSVSGLSSASFVSASPRMLTLVRNGETSHALYINGSTTPEVSGAKLGTDDATANSSFSYIGGVNSVAPVDFDGVYIVHVKRVLTPTEIADLYATLGAGNVFGLIAVPAATTTTLSGPASGTVGVASSNFTVGADGTITGTVIVTPSDGGAGGTFTPTTVSISSGTPTGTFTYTPASTGAKTISTTNNGSLSNPTSLTYTSNAAGDTTAPTLTSPTGTSTGTTTASGTVTTDEGNGTLYALATINATETAATVKASANTQAITTTGSKSVSFTGLTASTTYYAHYVHRDAAGNDSTVANSAAFTTSASGDTTLPTLTGAITPSAITSSGFTISWPAGADNVAVTGYEYSLDAGSTWSDIGNVLTKAVTGLTAATPYSVQVRDYDAAGNRALTPLSATVTTSPAPGAGTITTLAMTTPNGILLTSHTAHLSFAGVATGQQALYKSSQVSHATTGRMTVTDIALVPGTDYCVTTIDPNAAPGDPCGARVYRAS